MVVLKDDEMVMVELTSDTGPSFTTRHPVATIHHCYSTAGVSAVEHAIASALSDLAEHIHKAGTGDPF